MNAVASNLSRHTSWAVETANAHAWLHRPLCRTYAFAHFGRSFIRTQDRCADGLQEWRWAVGVLFDGYQEVLGAWRTDADLQDLQIWADLERRGVERVASATDEREASDQESPTEGRSANIASSLRSVGRSTLRKRSHEAGRRATDLAERVESAIERAARRHGPVANDSEASQLMANVLRRLDRHL